jgi:glycosyltransferase involved in cell wall biosynthesis/UDP-N-acetylglucosamine transferase subunit ALG13
VIFVTVGGSSEPFPRLTSALSRLPLNELVVQHGPNPIPDGVGQSFPFMDFAAVLDHMRRAEVVVSHAGAGSIICARRTGHTPIVVPRLARHGETVDDHQAELAAALEETGQAIVVWDLELLPEAIAAARPRQSAGNRTARVGPLQKAVRGAIHARRRPPRLAYLTTTYPGSNHAFIEREVSALRARGLELETFAIRPNNIGPQAANTTTLRPVSPKRLLAENGILLAAHPRRYADSLLLALSLGRGPRQRLWQAFYFAEAVLLARQCARRGVGHVHAHFGNPPGDVAMLAARLLGVPWSLTLHGTDVNHDDPELLAVKVEAATFVVCVGEFARDHLRRLVDRSHWSKLHVVRCGLDAEWFDAPVRDSIPDGRMRILSVARLEPPKDLETLLEATAELRRRGRAVELTLVGDGRLRQRLERRSRELELDGAVVFAGFVQQDALGGYYRAADIFCLSSSSEGVPVVLMEAMARGVPVIAPRLPGVLELVEEDRSGLLFTPEDAAELADSVERVASSAALGRRLAEAARVKVEAEFRIERSAAALEQLFRTVTRPPSQRRRRRRGRAGARDRAEGALRGR